MARIGKYLLLPWGQSSSSGYHQTDQCSCRTSCDVVGWALQGPTSHLRQKRWVFLWMNEWLYPSTQWKAISQLFELFLYHVTSQITNTGHLEQQHIHKTQKIFQQNPGIQLATILCCTCITSFTEIHQFKLFASIEWCSSFHFCYSRVIICKQCGLSWKSGSVFTVSDRKVLGTRDRRMHLKTSIICCCLLGMLYFSQRTAASQTWMEQHVGTKAFHSVFFFIYFFFYLL